MKSIPRILIVLALCGVSYGAEKPLWASHVPPDTAKTLFFVGRSPKVSSEAEGIRMASKDAREQLLRQEFGTTVKVDTTQKETLKDVSLDSQLSEISDLILLKGFKQTDVYPEKTDGDVEVWVLFSVPRSEIKAEKTRVAELQKQKAKFKDAPTPVAVESSSKEYNNGGKPKLRKGMKKSQVIELFGTPATAEKDNYDGKSEFVYHEDKSSFCGSIICFVYFDSRGGVISWAQFRPEYTTDMDDEPSPIKPAKGKRRKTAVGTTGPVIPAADMNRWSAQHPGEIPPGWTLEEPLPPGAIPEDEFVSDKDDFNSPETRAKLRKRCNRGDKESSCNILGNIEQGLGNLIAAKKLYLKACNANNMFGCDNLGLMKINKGNEKEGLRLFRKACDKRNFPACAHLALAEQNKGNPGAAKVHGKKACDGGEMLGCFALGLMELKQGNSVESFNLFKMACDGGRLEGCHYLGVFESKLGDKPNAKFHLKKACDGGYKPACTDLKTTMALKTPDSN